MAEGGVAIEFTDFIQNVLEAINDKKAENVIVLDLKAYSTITDYFLICSGLSHRQVKAIADAVLELSYRDKIRVHHIEGESAAEWVLIDLGDFVVHVFHEERRQFYQLENLWRGAVVMYQSEPATGNVRGDTIGGE